MKQILTIIATVLLSIAAFGQGKVGVNTIFPATTLHVDGAKDNINTMPAAMQQANDVVITQDGKLGVGTISPTAKITVAGGIEIDGYFSLIEPLGSGTIENKQGSLILRGFINPQNKVSLEYIDNGLTIVGPSGNENIESVANRFISTNEGVGYYLDRAAHSISLYTFLGAQPQTTDLCYNNHLTFLQNGNTGMGTPTPTEKLEVAGNIKAQRIFTTTSGSVIVPDYVFQKHFTGNSSLKPTYRFMPLHEVEAFTKANHHLPGYKNAAEVHKEGSIDITDNTLTNMEKIEELFLHAIELKKENKEMKKNLRQAQYDNEKIKNKVAKQDQIIAELLKRIERLEKN